MNPYSDWLRAGRLRGRSSSPGRVKKFFFSTSPRLTLRPTQSPIKWVLEVLPPGVKRLVREADHSPPTGAEIKETWIYASTSPHVIMAQCLISWTWTILLFIREIIRQNTVIFTAKLHRLLFQPLFLFCNRRISHCIKIDLATALSFIFICY
jgi:hypothetical protein